MELFDCEYAYLENWTDFTLGFSESIDDYRKLHKELMKLKEIDWNSLTDEEFRIKIELISDIEERGYIIAAHPERISKIYQMEDIKIEPYTEQEDYQKHLTEKRKEFQAALKQASPEEVKEMNDFIIDYYSGKGCGVPY